MKTTFVHRFVLLGVLLAASALIPTVSGGAGPAASWPYSNGDLSNTRDALTSTITVANVSKLKKLWSFTLTGNATPGQYQTALRSITFSDTTNNSTTSRKVSYVVSDSNDTGNVSGSATSTTRRPGLTTRLKSLRRSARRLAAHGRSGP